jgi:hypothetical protein
MVAQKEAVEYAVRYAREFSSVPNHPTYHVVTSRRPSKFSAVRSLQIFFPSNLSGGDDEETTRVYYVGLKGEWTPVCRCPSVGFLAPGPEQARGFRLRRTPMASSCMKHRRILAITRSRAWRMRKAADWGCNVSRTLLAARGWIFMCVSTSAVLFHQSMNAARMDSLETKVPSEYGLIFFDHLLDTALPFASAVGTP